MVQQILKGFQGANCLIHYLKEIQSFPHRKISRYFIIPPDHDRGELQTHHLRLTPHGFHFPSPRHEAGSSVFRLPSQLKK